MYTQFDPNNTTAALRTTHNTCPAACKKPLNDLANILSDVAQACFASSNLAVSALLFSFVALVCTCVSFFLRRNQQRPAEQPIVSSYGPLS